MTWRWRVAAVVAAVIVASSACGGDSATPALRGLVRERPLVVGDLTVTEVTATGVTSPFMLRARPGGLMVVMFGFTACPDICPTTLADMRSALRRLPEQQAERVDLAMVTVDPTRDTPEVMSAYLGSFLDRFHAVRLADPERLAKVQDAFLASSSVTVTSEGVVEVSHTSVIYVVNEAGVVVVEWPFATGPDSMAHDLGVLLTRNVSAVSS
jgi:protein SCO1